MLYPVVFAYLITDKRQQDTLTTRLANVAYRKKNVAYREQIVLEESLLPSTFGKGAELCESITSLEVRKLFIDVVK